MPLSTPVHSPGLAPDCLAGQKTRWDGGKQHCTIAGQGETALQHSGQSNATCSYYPVLHMQSFLVFFIRKLLARGALPPLPLLLLLMLMLRAT